ncbi:hypothetical protein HQ585_04905 [candidate division KSB1 bacterium]|nr:hypothetical protein [candidate division KSB1 bacterium]
MVKIKSDEAGWMMALTWLSAIEETARDFHGTRPKMFCKRVYDHAVEHYLRMLGEEYGFQIKKVDTIQSAVEQYIQMGVAGGLFSDKSQFELNAVNPYRLDMTVHQCVYLKSCQNLIDIGFNVRDLSCARIGCFRAAVKVLANIDCDYAVKSFNINGDCQGTIERV